MAHSLIDFVVVCGAPGDGGSSGEHDGGGEIDSETAGGVAMPRLPVARFISDIVPYFPGKGETVPAGYESLTGPSGREIDLNEGKFWKRSTRLAVRYSWSADHRGMPPPGHACRPIERIAVHQGPADARLPAGWETVRKTPTGRVANLNYGSSGHEIFLLLKRVPAAAAAAAHGSLLSAEGSDVEPGSVDRAVAAQATVVTDVTVIDTHFGEQTPPGFCKLDLNLNAGTGGHPLFLCTKRVPWLSKKGRVAPCLLERFPREDSVDSSVELPPSIEHFCMPRAVQVRELRSRADLPLPEWHPFVLTEGNGSRMYGAALVFWELVGDSDRNSETVAETGHDDPTPDSPPPPPLPPRNRANSPPPIHTHSRARLVVTSDGNRGKRRHERRKRKEKSARTDSAIVARTKCLSILSHYPFFKGFKKVLKLLYQLSISGQSQMPLERYVAHLTLCVPLPPPGTNVILDWGLGDNNAIVFSRPAREDLPPLGVSVLPLFHMLSAQRIARLLALVLLERKVILCSCDLDVITPILETIRVMIFPLDYSGIYIPMCATHIVEALLQAPMPFAIGLASEALDRIEVPDGIWIVDLDRDTIGLSSEGRILRVRDEDANGEWLVDDNVAGGSSERTRWSIERGSVLSSSSAAAQQYGEGCSGLPRDLFDRFVQRLESAAKASGIIRDGIADVSNVFQSSEVGALAADVSVDVARVRDAALRIMVELIGGYQHFLKISLSLEGSGHLHDGGAGGGSGSEAADPYSKSSNSRGSLEEVFDLKSFLDSKPGSWRPFLEALSESMAFARMMHERTVPSSSDLAFVFFDACHVRMCRNLALEAEAMGTWREHEADAEWRRRQEEPLRSQVLLLSGGLREDSRGGRSVDKASQYQTSSTFGHDTFQQALSYAIQMDNAQMEGDGTGVVEEIMEVFKRGKVQRMMLERDHVQGGNVGLERSSKGEHQGQDDDVEEDDVLHELKDEDIASPLSERKVYTYSTTSTCMSPDGRHQLVQGPDKFGLPISQNSWPTSTSFNFDDSLLWPRARLTHRVPVSMAETIAARSYLESNLDLDEAKRLYRKRSFGSGYYNCMVSAKDEDATGRKKATLMLRHVFGAWALTASAHIEAICLDGLSLTAVDKTLFGNRSRSCSISSSSSSTGMTSVVGLQLNRIEIGRRLALQVVKTMELFQGFIGAPLDQAAYRAVLVTCNAARLPFDEGARLVEVALQYYCTTSDDGTNSTTGQGASSGLKTRKHNDNAGAANIASYRSQSKDVDAENAAISDAEAEKRKVNALTAGQVSIARALYAKEIAQEREAEKARVELNGKRCDMPMEDSNQAAARNSRQSPSTSISSLEVQSILISTPTTSLSSSSSRERDDSPSLNNTRSGSSTTRKGHASNISARNRLSVELADLALLSSRVWRRRTGALTHPTSTKRAEKSLQPLKSLMCMWADYSSDNDLHTSSARSIPEAHVLLKVCSDLENGRSERGGDGRRRRRKRERQQRYFQEQQGRTAKEAVEPRSSMVTTPKKTRGRNNILRRQSSFNGFGFVAPSEIKARLHFICECTNDAAREANSQLREEILDRVDLLRTQSRASKVHDMIEKASEAITDDETELGIEEDRTCSDIVATKTASENASKLSHDLPSSAVTSVSNSDSGAEKSTLRPRSRSNSNSSNWSEREGPAQSHRRESTTVLNRVSSMQTIVKAMSRRASLFSSSPSRTTSSLSSPSGGSSNAVDAGSKPITPVMESEEKAISAELKAMVAADASMAAAKRRMHPSQAFEGQVSGFAATDRGMGLGVDNAAAAAGGGGSEMHAGKETIHSVAYISPLDLRTGLEEILMKSGRQVFSDVNLLRLRYPDLYFNMIWYCTRLRLPLPFFRQQVEVIEKTWDACQRNFDDINSHMKRAAEENVRCGPTESWARDCLRKRKAQRLEEANRDGVRACSINDVSKTDLLVKQLSVVEEGDDDDDDDDDEEADMTENRFDETQAEEPVTPSSVPIPSSPSDSDTNKSGQASSDPSSRLFVCSELSVSETEFLEKVHAGLRRGDVDDVLSMCLRSQHLHMPHVHSHPIYSMMRACAASGAACEVLLGTTDVSWPHPASEFGRSNFDKLFMKASSRLPPQQRLDYRELSSALGLTFTDRSAAAMRWCFGDIFHGTLEDAEEDLLEAEESLDTQKVTGEQEGVIQPLPSSSLKRHRSRAPLPLLEQHLIRERAANFSPLTQ